MGSLGVWAAGGAKRSVKVNCRDENQEDIKWFPNSGECVRNSKSRSPSKLSLDLPSCPGSINLTDNPTSNIEQSNGHLYVPSAIEPCLIGLVLEFARYIINRCSIMTVKNLSGLVSLKIPVGNRQISIIRCNQHWNFTWIVALFGSLWLNPRDPTSPTLFFFLSFSASLPLLVTSSLEDLLLGLGKPTISPSHLSKCLLLMAPLISPLPWPSVFRTIVAVTLPLRAKIS